MWNCSDVFRVAWVRIDITRYLNLPMVEKHKLTIPKVFCIVVEWLASLDEEDRQELKYFLYDDCCHFKPYAQVLKKNATFFLNISTLRIYRSLQLDITASTPSFWRT